jgi:hypothetical protein
MMTTNVPTSVFRWEGLCLMQGNRQTGFSVFPDAEWPNDVAHSLSKWFSLRHGQPVSCEGRRNGTGGAGGNPTEQGKASPYGRRWCVLPGA